jgi:hypothetical protein
MKKEVFYKDLMTNLLANGIKYKKSNIMNARSYNRITEPETTKVREEYTTAAFFKNTIIKQR